MCQVPAENVPVQTKVGIIYRTPFIFNVHEVLYVFYIQYNVYLYMLMEYSIHVQDVNGQQANIVNPNKI